MSTSEVLSASANSPPRPATGSVDVQTLVWARRALWFFVLVAGLGAMAMTLANEGLDGLGTPNGLKVLVGWSFAGSGLYAWSRRPENRLGPLMTAVGCTYLLAQILIQSQTSPVFTAGIWIADAWVVVFVSFLLAFPHGHVRPGFDLVVIGLFAIMAFPSSWPGSCFSIQAEAPRTRSSSGRTPTSRATSTRHSVRSLRRRPSSWLSP